MARQTLVVTVGDPSGSFDLVDLETGVVIHTASNHPDLELFASDYLTDRHHRVLYTYEAARQAFGQ